jgi:hypothetical protein
VSNRLRRWPLAVLLAIDQLANALAMGSEDETISSRAWKAKVKGKAWGRAAVWVIDALFGRDHCARSVELDEV